MSNYLRRMAGCNAVAKGVTSLVLIAALGFGSVVQAQTETFHLRAELSGDNFPTPTGSPGSGYAEFTLVNIPGFDSWMDYKIQLDGVDLGGFTPGDTSDDITPGILEDNVERIHIHGGWPGVGGLLFEIYDVITKPTTKTDDLDDLMVDIPNGMVSGRWDSADVGAQSPFHHLFELTNTKTYLNVHTIEFPLGEIRGPLVLPEPGTFVIAALGILALVPMRWRRRHRG
jgi:hypothetical protein